MMSSMADSVFASKESGLATVKEDEKMLESLIFEVSSFFLA